MLAGICIALFLYQGEKCPIHELGIFPLVSTYWSMVYDFNKFE